MKFEESNYFNTLKPHKITMPYGDFYFCEKFYLAEINEGIHLDYDKLISLMIELVGYYGKDRKIGFISNRINPYSLDPHVYNKIDQEFNMIAASAYVVYSDLSYMNATIEKRFTKKSLKRCISIEEAVDWILNIKELN
ncbi:hypothetical protein [Confluentibacter citreus]|uniref:hypothetical protein n=1 Tax=Confluentibacter citreus TaxID=2007307 RepID=UPI000C28CCA5|nr:hypothetical protein [Confluentibacter citreus]